MSRSVTVAATVTTAVGRTEFFQFRSRPAPAAWIRAAAAQRGITISEFLREAAEHAARHQLSRGIESSQFAGAA